MANINLSTKSVNLSTQKTDYKLIEEAIQSVIDDNKKDGYIDPMFFFYAMHYLQQNPGDSIENAIEYALMEWCA